MTAPAGGPPVVRLTVWGVDRVLPALGRVATTHARLRTRRDPGPTAGLMFAKVLGTGSGRTFTPRDADLRHWAVLTVWADAEVARGFDTTGLARAWDHAAYERLDVTVATLTSRGRWSRREPFRASADRTRTGPVAALTRARLRPTRTLRFWDAVPPVVRDLDRAPGLRLALGIGEAPLGLQGTFSLWESDQQLTDFAYRSAAHRAAMARTPTEDWYAEELFARFAVREVRGTYRGRRP